MELAEIAPFLFILSVKNYKGCYTDVTLEDFDEKLSKVNHSKTMQSRVYSILENFPHKNYIPISYLLKHPFLKNEEPSSVISILLEHASLVPIYNKSGLCFSFHNKSKVAKLADIVEENPFNMLNEVIKVAFDAKKGKIGEDLLVSLTNGIEKLYKNTSENYLRVVSDKPMKSHKKPAIFSKETTKVLRDISNSGHN